MPKASEKVCLDCTSAPGNKSIQASEYFKSVYACERDSKWFATLSEWVKLASATNIIPVETDVLEWINEKVRPEIEVVICDPSCSGSGLNLHCDEFITKCWS